MKYKKIMIMLVLAVFIFGAASVCANDVNDEAIAGEDVSAVELPVDDTGGIITIDENEDKLSENEQTFLDLRNLIEGNTDKDIYLNHDYKYPDGYFGLSEGIVIDRDINIYGNGHTINGSNHCRIFKISSGNVVFHDITFANGMAPYSGGALYFDDGTSGTVINCNFIGNTAKDGSAVYFVEGSAGGTINCNFIDNTATSSGGALVFLGNGTVTGCNFINNSGMSGSGGAVYFSEGTVTGCNFTGNSASYGGAVYFTNNGTVSESCFTDNFASYGGAVYFYSEGSVSNCNFTGNNVTESYSYFGGGAVYFRNKGTVSNSNFVNNFAASGGAVYFTNNGTVSNCNFTGNTATGYGGAIRMTSGNVSNSNFDDNTAHYCGAIFFYNAGTVTNCSFINHFGLLYGGAIGMETGNVSNCNFTGNNVTESNTYHGGGAVYFTNNGTVSNCNFANNHADMGHGGAICFHNIGTVINCNFTGNSANYGGAVYFYDGGNVSNCNFADNNAEPESGGAVWMHYGVVSNSNFVNNSAIYYGGAVYFYDGGDVSNCNFTGNTAMDQGGAIRMTSGNVSNSNFAGNTVFGEDGYGGGALFFNAGGDVSNCNFTDNAVKYYGGAVYFVNYGDVSNCNFIGNNAEAGSAIYLYTHLSIGNISNSCFLNNRANSIALNVVPHENNILITFSARNTFINSIFSGGGEVTFTNVTYWGVEGITNSDISAPVRFGRPGQNITVGVVVNDEVVLDEVFVTDENGQIVVDVNIGDNYFISARHEEDSYYTEAEKIITNMKLYANVTSLTIHNKTVNITAKSNIFGEVMPGKLLFILPDGTEINATYGANGIWWAEYTFDDLGVYQVTASYVGLDNVTVSNGTIAVNAPEHTFWFLNYTINGNDNPVIKLSNDFYFDPAYDSAFVNGIVINRPVTIKGNGVVINAKGQARIFDIQSEDAVIENLTLKNANYNSGNGGAIHFASSGTVSNCNFTNNTAYEGGAVYFTGAGIVSNCTFTGNTARWYGGALRFRYSSTVSNCTFTGNTATGSGGAIYSLSGTLTNCNFTGNTATGSGGAIMFVSSTTVSNCNFNDNSASRGGAVWMSFGSVSNSNFICNNATTGSAIYFGSASALSNSILLNNKADAEAVDVVKNDDNITITFTGRNNLLNAIYSEGDVTFTNVTYWGANGIATVSATMSGSNKVAGQNVTVEVVVNGVLVLNDVYVTDENGTIVLENMNLDGNYFITVRHDDDSYYTRAETILTNMELHANVTSIATNNRTVNLTAKSNIYGGKFQFVLSDGTKIDANYASNGIWWAVYTFDDYAEYNVSASYLESDNVTVSNGTITITRADSAITLDKTVFDYGDSINIATVGAVGITAKIDGNDVTVVDFIIPLSGLNAGTYNLTVTTIPDENHNPVTVNATITINKLQTVLTGNAVTAVYNINKDLVITLKDAKGNPLSGASVTVDLNGLKTYITDSNGQIKVSTKGLAPKAYTAKVTFNGNANYVASAKDIKVTVKKATPKMAAKKKTFKRTVKTKKYTIVLKDNTGKAMKKVKVTLKIKGKKTITAKTNSKGKATFKIKKLTKKGTYKTTVTFKGNKYYNKVVKKVKIKIK